MSAKKWAVDVTSLLGELGKEVAGAAARVAHAAFGDEPYEILVYRGYGDGRRAFVHGRVIEKRVIGSSTDSDSTLRNLFNTYRRADSDPLPFARVSAEYDGATIEVKADDEGFFEGWVEAAKTDLDGKEWRKCSMELLTPPDPAIQKVTGDGEILVPPSSARFCIISDIDDTVIQSRVSNFLVAARTVILGNARTRLPFPGVAAFYDALRNGASGDEKNPVFFVSSSPWNIYDVITEFMDIQKIPKGPLVLRDWDIGWNSLSSGIHVEHKTTVIRNIMKLYPSLPFILIGDTGQQDPEIYRKIVAEFPDRVKAIYIRDVTRTPERSASVKKLADEVLAANSTLVLAEDTYDAAKHAAEQGWISKDALPLVKDEKRADEGKDETKVATPGGGKPSTGEGPTVVSAP